MRKASSTPASSSIQSETSKGVQAPLQTANLVHLDRQLCICTCACAAVTDRPKQSRDTEAPLLPHCRYTQQSFNFGSRAVKLLVSESACSEPLPFISTSSPQLMWALQCQLTSAMCCRVQLLGACTGDSHPVPVPRAADFDLTGARAPEA